MNYKTENIAGTRVLIVDDDRQNRLVIRRALERDGYWISETQTASEVFRIVDEDPPDVLLLDILMPEIDGLTICRRVREKHSAAELPILFITGRSADEDLAKGLEAGANDYISKPVSFAVLRARLRTQVTLLRANLGLRRTYNQLAREKSMKTIGMFAAGIAHNFNNLLGTVLSSAEFIEMSCAQGSEIHQAVRLIMAAATRGTQLTESVLALARTGEAPVCEDPGRIIAGTEEFVRMLARDRIRYSVEVNLALPPIAMAGADLSRILLELLTNSADAICGEGAITLRVYLDESAAGERGRQVVVFEVCDTGCGIEGSDVNRIFEPFLAHKRLDAESVITFDGSGLGLSVVYNVIRSCGGTIEVKETGLAGTTIRFTVPIV